MSGFLEGKCPKRLGPRMTQTAGVADFMGAEQVSSADWALLKWPSCICLYLLCKLEGQPNIQPPILLITLILITVLGERLWPSQNHSGINSAPVPCRGCVLLHDGPCELSSSKWRLLLGLRPTAKTGKDLEMGQWQSWFDHLQHQSHWLFVVRRSGALGQSWHLFLDFLQ